MGMAIEEGDDTVTDRQSEPLSTRIELEVSDPSLVVAVRDRLARIPGSTVELLPAQMGPGRLGGSDVVEFLAGSSGVLAVALRMLPEIIRAARTNLTIRIKYGDQELTVSAANADEVVKLISVSNDE